MSLFPHLCTECGKWFSHGGRIRHVYDSTLYFCDRCIEREDEERRRQGIPQCGASNEEWEAYAKIVHERKHNVYLADLEKEERIKARVWGEEKRRAQLEKEE
jgi:hypothetical protein